MKRTVIVSAAFILGLGGAVAQTIVVTPEVQTEFKTYVTTQKVAPVEIDAQIAVGATLPETVVLQPVPDVIVTKSPEFKDYRYAVVGSRVVIVEPSTTKVVAVVE
jgi:hypothetical protein